MEILKHDWKFLKEDLVDAYKIDFDDSAWRTVTVPHDYAIEGPFSPENDRQVQGVFQDGINHPMVHIGRTGGLPIDQGAWYRRTITVSEKAKHVFLEFDGLMSNATIYLNGKKCKEQRYGYTSFSLDITNDCQTGENLLAIHLAPKGTSSRWYSGAGVYREVRLVEKQESYFPYHAGFVIPEIKGNVGYVECNIQVQNFTKNSSLEYRILNANGDVVQSRLDKTNSIQLFQMDGYVKWNIHDSYLYTLEVILYDKNEVKDCYKTTFGFRTLEFHPEKGFIINHKRMKLNGVCLHHDLGALGAAFSKAAAKRQLEKLIDIGVNSIRTSHNPPAPEFLDLCDELGLVVIDEAFDEWKSLKVQNGYGHHFEEDAKKDLVAMIRRDRNHPSVIMWSIGNEIFEETMRNGWTYCKFLSDICKKEDRSRLVTAGVPRPWEAFRNGFCDFLDVVGINYRPQMYERLHQEYPNVPLYASETASCISSRGTYYLPTELELLAYKREELQINSNDLESTSNGYYPEREFYFQDKHDFMCGEYVWTGFDYIGEPSPYREEWSSRSSYFGIYDLAGLPKDRVYSYMTKWTDKDVMHLFPHWNWKEGDVIDVHCYSNYDEVELFLNGKSMGISVKNEADDVLRHRHIWRKITYVSGEIKAVAVRNPRVVDCIKTAGDFARIILEPERREITSDGDDLVYVVCTAVDADGNICPKECAKVSFEVTGAGNYVAADAGDATSTRLFHENYCELFQGKCVAIIRSLNGEKGTITVTAHNKKTGVSTCTINSV